MTFLQLFGRLKSVVIGMVHVKALPGTPGNTLPVAQIAEEACREAEIYRAAGVAQTGFLLTSGHVHGGEEYSWLLVKMDTSHDAYLFSPGSEEHAYYIGCFGTQDGLIVENMHDRPYTVRIGAEITAAMTVVCATVKRACPSLPLGIQILCAANQQALAVALAAGLDFIRAEGFVFSHVADEGILDACAGDLLRYRKQIGAEHVQIFADVKKKHSAHVLTADISIAETAKAAELFLADGVVLTGTATGLEADPKELEEVGRAVKIPVLIGSGVTLENVKGYLGANALIVGSHFKKEGYWANGVDADRVKRFMAHIGKLRERNC